MNVQNQKACKTAQVLGNHLRTDRWTKTHAENKNMNTERTRAGRANEKKKN